MTNGAVAIDYSDPCAVLAALQPAYFKLLSGAGPQRIQISTAAGVRDVSFAPTNLAQLERVIIMLDGQCRVQQGLPPTRRAIKAGSMGIPQGYDWLMLSPWLW